MYGKATQTAIAAMSRLAEVYDGGRTRLSATAIAESRGLQRPFVGKVLTALAQAGLVTGSRGPGGGFSLARPPEEITLHDVFRLFEREDDSGMCPFGGGVCGTDAPCPLHEKLVRVQEAVDEVLFHTTFAVFCLPAAQRDESQAGEESHNGKPQGRAENRDPARAPGNPQGNPGAKRSEPRRIRTTPRPTYRPPTSR